MTTKVAVGLILGCALLGGYTSMFTSYQYGYLDALRNCVSSLPSKACILDMSGAVTPSITGVNAIDDLLNILFQFFSQGLRTDPHVEGTDLEALLAFVYLAAQFGGAWYIIALEGLRRGNKGSILSWTGSFGAIFQAITVTIVAPIYLTLQLLRSSSDKRIETLLVDSFDLNLLPLSAVLAYVLPTAALCLPLLNLIHGKTKLLAVAFWQPFPLYHTIIRSLSTKLGPKIYYEDNTPSTAELERCRKALRKSNRIITSLAVAVHVAVMSTVFTASRATGLIASVSARHIFALTSIQSPPATNRNAFGPEGIVAISMVIFNTLEFTVIEEHRQQEHASAFEDALPMECGFVVPDIKLVNHFEALKKQKPLFLGINTSSTGRA
ncbi:hypothetical protein E8E13_000243 [Curvularia kusanoi]|uniref:Uncharacterized protein n=1 Tax=Curvularia kusanoi TaxID=90978 RepID=A0A9P4TMF4_CURKU|nr:hypothetical protein E8E13_000243 [Curvularia kusanoi]